MNANPKKRERYFKEILTEITLEARLKKRPGRRNERKTRTYCRHRYPHALRDEKRSLPQFSHIILLK